MASVYNHLSQTTCASLLQELQIIWDEIGESYVERDKMLFEIECLDLYGRKVETRRMYKADLHHCLAQSESEIASLVSSRDNGTDQEMDEIMEFLDEFSYSQNYWAVDSPLEENVYRS